jgi:hypothetical protein
MLFVLATTLYAGFTNLTQRYLPEQSYLNAGLTIMMMVMAVLITLDSARVWGKMVKEISRTCGRNL